MSGEDDGDFEEVVARKGKKKAEEIVKGSSASSKPKSQQLRTQGQHGNNHCKNDSKNHQQPKHPPNTSIAPSVETVSSVQAKPTASGGVNAAWNKRLQEHRQSHTMSLTVEETNGFNEPKSEFQFRGLVDASNICNTLDEPRFDRNAFFFFSHCSSLLHTEEFPILAMYVFGILFFKPYFWCILLSGDNFRISCTCY